MRRAALLLACAALLGTGAACVDRLPDQDLRIVDATPAARLSADILWNEYAADRGSADRQYFGKAIVVTGTVTGMSTLPGEADGPERHVVAFGQTDANGIQLRLLDEQASAIVEGLDTGQRLTLKCYCEGLSDDAGGDVLLKSCVRP